MAFSSATQKTKENLDRLAAQRYLYTSAKALIVLQYVAISVIALAGVAGSLYFGFKVSIASLVFAILDSFFLERFIRGRLKEAALIQEDFDCEVLELEWSKTKCGSKVAMEEIHQYASKMDGSVKFQKLKDWYPTKAFSLPVQMGRIICQRANVVWNLSGRRKILITLNIIGLVVVAVLIATLAFGQLTTEQWLSCILIPLTPFLVRWRDVWLRISESIVRMGHLQSRIGDMWNESLSGNTSTDKLKERSREFQSELFDFRSREIPVFDHFYWKLRDAKEKSMNKTAEAFVIEAEERIRAGQN